MLIGLIILMTENPPVATWYILAAQLFLESLENNAQWLIHRLKQNIRLLQMVLLSFCGFGLYCQIFIFPLKLWLSFSVIIWVLSTCLLNLSFMLALSMLKSIITLFVIALLKRKLQFGSSPSRINLLMCLPSSSSCILHLFSVQTLCGFSSFNLRGHIMECYYVYIFILYFLI
jgi:type IV secretory pathway TrbD component